MTAFISLPTQAQTVFATFDGGDISAAGEFFGGADGVGAGVGPTDGLNGAADAALSLGVNPGAGGGFAGVAVTADPAVDVSGAEYFTFYLRPNVNEDNLPLTLEVNLQEDANGDGTYDPATEDEYQALWRLSAGDPTYRLVQIPLAAFVDDNSVNAGADDGFDFTRVKFVVFALGNMQGSPFNLSFDEFVFTTEPIAAPSPVVSFATFADGDVSSASAFFGGADGVGAGVGPTDDQNGTADAALSLGVNPGAGGGFAGVAVTASPAIDASGAEYFTFLLRPNLQEGNIPLTLEVNLQEDANGDGAYDPATEDEYQALWRLDVREPRYERVQIPLAAFVDDNSVNAGANDGFDFTQIINVVYAMGNMQGPGFNLSFDELGFDAGVTTSVEPGTPDLPSAYVLTNAYPNPFNPQAQFELTMQQTQDVRVALFDVLGREVAVLHDGTLAGQAAHTFRIDGQNLPSGMYLYRVTGESFSEARSIVLLK